MTSLEHQALSDEGVVVVVLGESFERWKASQLLKLRRDDERFDVSTTSDKYSLAALKSHTNPVEP